MPEMKEHAPGTFCWVELGTTDAEGAKRFYSDLFGLQGADNPMPGGGGVYTILQKDGKFTAAAGVTLKSAAGASQQTLVARAETVARQIETEMRAMATKK